MLDGKAKKENENIHIITDTNGWLLSAVVHAANEHDSQTDFKPLHRRWIIERTFSWLENFRRLAKDYEYTVSSSIAMIFLAFILLALNKISCLS
ncbi:MAG: transposase [Prevotellaceae bacterium]|jgi:putative transposase|nr:transposase [Prevotellaceae bacterium]